MYYLEITKEEIENLFSMEGISRKELRYLMKTNSNKLINIFTIEFKKNLSALKTSEQGEINLRGFIHSPPKNLLLAFNQIHYQLKEEYGDYELALLSPSHVELEYAIPIIIPKEQINSKDYNKAHFAKIIGKINNFINFKNKISARFVVSNEIYFLGFDELFTIEKPNINLKDIKEMFNNKFNTPKDISNAVVFWLFSSPFYHGRKGGNAFSPILANEYKIDKKSLKLFNKNISDISLPYFTTKKSITAKFEYFNKSIHKLKFKKCSKIQYRFETKLNKANEFLNRRNSYKGIPKSSELSLTTSSIDLSFSTSRPIEDFITNPILETKILSLTDIPLFLEKGDINIDEKEKEIFDYSFDINQFIYLNSLRIPRIQINALDAVEILNSVNKEIKRAMSKLYELMNYGIIFDNSMIRGFGEHVIRIAHAIYRSTEKNTIYGSLDLTKNLYLKIFTRLYDVLPIDKLYYQLEEAKFEKYNQKTYVLRDTINSIFFELENNFTDGWTYQEFENQMKNRTDLRKSKIKEYFYLLIKEGEITEISPCLYRHIFGFDRYI